MTQKDVPYILTDLPVSVQTVETTQTITIWGDSWIVELDK